MKRWFHPEETCVFNHSHILHFLCDDLNYWLALCLWDLGGERRVGRGPNQMQSSKTPDLTNCNHDTWELHMKYGNLNSLMTFMKPWYLSPGEVKKGRNCKISSEVWSFSLPKAHFQASIVAPCLLDSLDSFRRMSHLFFVKSACVMSLSKCIIHLFTSDSVS